MSADGVLDMDTAAALVGLPTPRRDVEPVAVGLVARHPVAHQGIPAAILDEDVIRQVMWHYSLAGSRGDRDIPSHFQAALMVAFQRADAENFDRLRAAFPVLGFWMHAMRFGTDGHRLALRAFYQLGVTP